MTLTATLAFTGRNRATWSSLDGPNDNPLPVPYGATTIVDGTAAAGFAISNGFVSPASEGSAIAGTLVFNNAGATTWTVTVTDDTPEPSVESTPSLTWVGGGTYPKFDVAVSGLLVNDEIQIQIAASSDPTFSSVLRSCTVTASLANMDAAAADGDIASTLSAGSYIARGRVVRGGTPGAWSETESFEAGAFTVTQRVSNAIATNNSAGVAYSHSVAATGTASNFRHILAYVCATGSSTTHDITSVTFKPNTGTDVVLTPFTGSFNGQQTTRDNNMFYGAIPEGTSGTIEVVYTKSSNNSLCIAWTIENTSQTTPQQVSRSAEGSKTNYSRSFTSLPTGSAIFMGLFQYVSSSDLQNGISATSGTASVGTYSTVTADSAVRAYAGFLYDCSGDVTGQMSLDSAASVFQCSCIWEP